METVVKQEDILTTEADISLTSTDHDLLRIKEESLDIEFVQETDSESDGREYMCGQCFLHFETQELIQNHMETCVSKKITRGDLKWKRRKSAQAREAGEMYVNYKNEVVQKKEIKLGVLCRENCRLSCSSRFNLDMRQSALSDFYKLDVNGKNKLLFKCITKKPVARMRANATKHRQNSYSYSVPVCGEQVTVCKGALCGLFQIGARKLAVIKDKINTGADAPSPDARGKHWSRRRKND